MPHKKVRKYCCFYLVKGDVRIGRTANQIVNGSHLPEVAAFVKFFAAVDYAMELEV